MNIASVSLCIFGIFCFSSCKDDAVSPPPGGEFSVTITVRSPNGSAVPGLRVSAWNHLSYDMASPTLGVFETIPARASSTITFALAYQASVTLSVFDMRDSLVSTIVDDRLEAGHYSANWAIQVQRPTSVFKYILVARATMSGAILFRDSLFAVLQQPDADVSILGWTSRDGSVSTNDERLFPNTLDLPPLIRTGSGGPDSIGVFAIQDTVTIIVSDTVTHRQMEFNRVVNKGVTNFIQLVWNPASALRGSLDKHAVEKRHEGVTKSGLQTPPFDWALRQNYPNPFN